MLIDVDSEDFNEIILEGGSGGFGNAHFKSSTNRAPRRTTPGWNGEEMWIWLKLKLLCDVGLVGMPNAGKSTFVSATTRAKPKIADYPFTTLKPKLGVVYIDESEFVISDIPGLIEGAHKGQGLGHRFLKHIERSRVLLHLIDISDDDYIDNYHKIREELVKYSPKLAEKKEVIALNKCDIFDEEEIQARLELFEEYADRSAHIISTATNNNIKPVLRELNNIIEEEKRQERQAKSEQAAQENQDIENEKELLTEQEEEDFSEVS
jgi:GTP-binding protein